MFISHRTVNRSIQKKGSTREILSRVSDFQRSLSCFFVLLTGTSRDFSPLSCRPILLFKFFAITTPDWFLPLVYSFDKSMPPVIGIPRGSHNIFDSISLRLLPLIFLRKGQLFWTSFAPPEVVCQNPWKLPKKPRKRLNRRLTESKKQQLLASREIVSSFLTTMPLSSPPFPVTVRPSRSGPAFPTGLPYPHLFPATLDFWLDSLGPEYDPGCPAFHSVRISKEQIPKFSRSFSSPSPPMLSISAIVEPSTGNLLSVTELLVPNEFSSLLPFFTLKNYFNFFHSLLLPESVSPSSLWFQDRSKGFVIEFLCFTVCIDKVEIKQ